MIWGTLLLLTLAGCSNHVRYPSELPSERTFTLTDTYFLWGQIGEASYELYEFCRKGAVYEVHSRASLVQGALTVVSLGVYAPRTVTITCSARGDGPEEMMEEVEEVGQTSRRPAKMESSSAEMMDMEPNEELMLEDASAPMDDMSETAEAPASERQMQDKPAQEVNRTRRTNPLLMEPPPENAPASPEMRPKQPIRDPSRINNPFRLN